MELHPYQEGEDFWRRNQEESVDSVAPVLVLSGPPYDNLEVAESHVLNSPQTYEVAGLQPIILHFFGRSARDIQRPNTSATTADKWWLVLCIHSFLWQLVKIYPLA